MGGFDISLGLGLGLGLGSDHDAKTESDDHHVSSSPSLVSSLFSNSSSIKRERDQFTSSDDLEPEVENNNIPSNIGNLTRKKLRLTKEQSAVLEDTFKHHSTIHPKQKQELARKLNLETRQVEVWFQNRRARTKLKQTEVECEVLKKCYEKLSEENKRLQKELKELKTMKTTAREPFYMQLPVATPTVCPSCKRISGGSGGAGEISNNGSNTPAIIGPMPHHHFYTFTHSSAAC